ncbi:type III secretion system protein [Yokenella regensburgei]|uniref:type III secretion system protein n=1 Tax=Yokenella regensburgei TaxID=158877 RepID=UPI0013763E89|nr:type III secretion system protein [Yokenella regensburgei]KAF1368341.1 chromosome segregation ATPase [Yokenella regensburgei]
MEAWRKGCDFVSLLERKQQILQGDIVKTENRLAKIRLTIAEYQQECADINQQIRMLTPSGLHSRADIYKGIRQQGALLTHQQLVLHKINQLENEKYNLENKLEQHRAAMILLDKKHYKLSYYLQPLRREYIRRCDNDAENEIQEIAGYGRKSF